MEFLHHTGFSGRPNSTRERICTASIKGRALGKLSRKQAAQTPIMPDTGCAGLRHSWQAKDLDALSLPIPRQCSGYTLGNDRHGSYSEARRTPTGGSAAHHSPDSRCCRSGVRAYFLRIRTPARHLSRYARRAPGSLLALEGRRNGRQGSKRSRARGHPTQASHNMLGNPM